MINVMKNICKLIYNIRHLIFLIKLKPHRQKMSNKLNLEILFTGWLNTYNPGATHMLALLVSGVNQFDNKNDKKYISFKTLAGIELVSLCITKELTWQKILNHILPFSKHPQFISINGDIIKTIEEIKSHHVVNVVHGELWTGRIILPDIGDTYVMRSSKKSKSNNVVIIGIEQTYTDLMHIVQIKYPKYKSEKNEIFIKKIITVYDDNFVEFFTIDNHLLIQMTGYIYEIDLDKSILHFNKIGNKINGCCVTENNKYIILTSYLDTNHYEYQIYQYVNNKFTYIRSIISNSESYKVCDDILIIHHDKSTICRLNMKNGDIKKTVITLSCFMLYHTIFHPKSNTCLTIENLGNYPDSIHKIIKINLDTGLLTYITTLIHNYYTHELIYNIYKLNSNRFIFKTTSNNAYMYDAQNDSFNAITKYDEQIKNHKKIQNRDKQYCVIKQQIIYITVNDEYNIDADIKIRLIDNGIPVLKT